MLYVLHGLVSFLLKILHTKSIYLLPFVVIGKVVNSIRPKLGVLHLRFSAIPKYGNYIGKLKTLEWGLKTRFNITGKKDKTTYFFYKRTLGLHLS